MRTWDIYRVDGNHVEYPLIVTDRIDTTIDKFIHDAHRVSYISPYAFNDILSLKNHIKSSDNNAFSVIELNSGYLVLGREAVEEDIDMFRSTIVPALWLDEYLVRDMEDNSITDMKEAA